MLSIELVVQFIFCVQLVQLVLFIQLFQFIISSSSSTSTRSSSSSSLSGLFSSSSSSSSSSLYSSSSASSSSSSFSSYNSSSSSQFIWFLLVLTWCTILDFHKGGHVLPCGGLFKDSRILPWEDKSPPKMLNSKDFFCQGTTHCKLNVIFFNCSALRTFFAWGGQKY